MDRKETRLESDREVRVPFQGFYNTAHDNVFDIVLEQINTDDSNDTVQVISMDNVEWAAVRLGYAQKYLAELDKTLALGARFSRIIGQKDYANGNDTLLARVDCNKLNELHDAINADPARKAAWADHVKEALTERPGFIPYFSAEVEEWGAFEDWDDAQIDCMLTFRGIELEIDETEIAMELMEYLDEKIWSSVIDPDQVPGHVDNKTETQLSI